ncbi:inclusion body family protein [Pseudomonas sp. B21-048]|uniref:inclusion body family protein n=1 Tax=Pseudomonas sp. B21-048 TaxID=2895490 RepID=UPI00215F1471|nr:inclusion body family protein [Pseudomonas sp. B21-048]UVL01280.1 inclusion body family protein [Pseudomonas sp. B21-048]
MTSEPITSPSADAVTANSVLLIVDAESLLSRYPQPSLDPQKPTVIEDGFIFAISATTAAQNIINDSKIILTTNNGKVFHIRGRTVSLLAEHTVVFHNMTVHDTGILSPPKLIVHGDQTVPSPDPSNPTQPGSHSADDHYWECSQLSTGAATCELSFMLINQRCEAVGYFSWKTEVTLSA